MDIAWTLLPEQRPSTSAECSRLPRHQQCSGVWTDCCRDGVGRRSRCAAAGPLVGPCSAAGEVPDKRWNLPSRVSPRATVGVLRASILPPAWNSPTPPKFSLSLSVPAQEYLNCPFVANSTLIFLPFLRNQQSQAPRFPRAQRNQTIVAWCAMIWYLQELAGTASLRVHVSARSILLLGWGKAVRHLVKIYISRSQRRIHGRSTTTAMEINEVSFHFFSLPSRIIFTLHPIRLRMMTTSEMSSFPNWIDHERRLVCFGLPPTGVGLLLASNFFWLKRIALLHFSPSPSTRVSTAVFANIPADSIPQTETESSRAWLSWHKRCPRALFVASAFLFLRQTTFVITNHNSWITAQLHIKRLVHTLCSLHINTTPPILMMKISYIRSFHSRPHLRAFLGVRWGRSLPWMSDWIIKHFVV